MTSQHFARRVRASIALAFVASASHALEAQTLDPLVQTINLPDPALKTFNIDVVVPTGKRDSVDLMMAIWSPGFYRLQNYADKVTTFCGEGARWQRSSATSTSMR